MAADHELKPDTHWREAHRRFQSGHCTCGSWQYVASSTGSEERAAYNNLAARHKRHVAEETVTVERCPDHLEPVGGGRSCIACDGGVF